MRDEDAIQEGLREIDLKLQLHRKTNEQVNLPPAMHTTTELQRMENSFPPADCTAYADMHEPKLTSEQHDVNSKVLKSVSSRDGKAYMIHSRAGTGKSYTIKCIAARLRGQGKIIVLIVASTGIAALQLPGAWTAHSMFKLPMDESLLCGTTLHHHVSGLKFLGMAIID